MRDILGQTQGHIPPLSAHFRNKLHSLLGFEVPESAWWATDYHINWLAGAIAVYGRQSEQLPPFPNPPFPPLRPADSSTARKLVEGNQEDIDLVISFGQHLILVEAKAYGTFTDRQINSKLARLNILYDRSINKR